MNKIQSIIIGFAVILSAFYWFQYRPSKILSHCDWKAKSKAGWDVSKYSTKRRTMYKDVYDSCLHEKGLK